MGKKKAEDKRTESQRVMHSINRFRVCLGFPGGSDGKESACNAGDPSSILGRVDPLTGIQEKKREWEKYFEK